MPIAINGSGSITGLTKTGISAQPVFPGNVIQVVNASYSTAVTSTSTSFADTGLSASITMSSSTSKILVLISQQFAAGGLALGAGLYRASVGVIALRNSTQISNNSGSDTAGRYGMMLSLSASASNQGFAGYWSGMFLDTPGSGTHTYKTQFAVGLAGNSITAQIGPANEQSTITLLEVAA